MICDGEARVGKFRQRSTPYRHSLLCPIVSLKGESNVASRSDNPAGDADTESRCDHVMSHLAIPTRNPGATTRRVRNHGSISTLRHTASTPSREGDGTLPKPRRTMRVEMQVASPRATSGTQTPAASHPATLELKNSDPTQNLSTLTNIETSRSRTPSWHRLRHRPGRCFVV